MKTDITQEECNSEMERGREKEREREKAREPGVQEANNYELRISHANSKQPAQNNQQQSVKISLHE
ncbi:hypothetical protein T4A_2293 [Trichinella pseudospiralis]|uniref:Uncharacterized protein n=1 Tax=Trichinella pseudospiralis TaxID=6337 RepID=A0A0V1E6T8_TRIPS|nr:hypothetical protein T4A_2293 [Trichinella pseudospiralis]